MNGLSNDQKRIIAQLARQAYNAWPEREAFEAINCEMSRTACFEAWRHVEQGKAVGIQSLCECTQGHYRSLKAHFEKLCGLTDRAAWTLAREAGNDRRIAACKLRDELAARDLTEGYAAAICRRQYGCALSEASAKQLWSLVFTVRNRRKRATVPHEAPTNGDPF